MSEKKPELVEVKSSETFKAPQDLIRQRICERNDARHINGLGRENPEGSQSNVLTRMDHAMEKMLNTHASLVRMIEAAGGQLPGTRITIDPRDMFSSADALNYLAMEISDAVDTLDEMTGLYIIRPTLSDAAVLNLNPDGPHAHAQTRLSA